jgi:5-hydroxyisourate hydrolase-like protein (transthyretin family)
VLLRSFGVLVGTVLLIASPALAQHRTIEVTMGQVRGLAGEVVDPSGASIGNVTVVRTSEDGKKELATTHTDSNGHFAFDDVPDGRYTLRFTVAGFAKMIVHLTVFHKMHKVLHVVMQVGF